MMARAFVAGALLASVLAGCTGDGDGAQEAGGTPFVTSLEVDPPDESGFPWRVTFFVVNPGASTVDLQYEVGHRSDGASIPHGSRPLLVDANSERGVAVEDCIDASDGSVLTFYVALYTDWREGEAGAGGTPTVERGAEPSVEVRAPSRHAQICSPWGLRDA